MRAGRSAPPSRDQMVRALSNAAQAVNERWRMTCSGSERADAEQEIRALVGIHARLDADGECACLRAVRGEQLRPEQLS